MGRGREKSKKLILTSSDRKKISLLDKKFFFSDLLFDADYRGEVRFAQFRFLKKIFFFLEKICQKKTFYCGCEFAWAWAYFVQNFFLIILGAPTQKSAYAPTQKWPKTEKTRFFFSLTSNICVGVK